jgi:maltoporin
MKIIKQLPLTMAVIAALCPISVLAQETMSQEQIDQIVAKAVDIVKRK